MSGEQGHRDFNPNSIDSQFTRLNTRLDRFDEDNRQIISKLEHITSSDTVREHKIAEIANKLETNTNWTTSIAKKVTKMEQGKLYAVGWIAGASFIIVIVFNLLWAAVRATFKLN